MDIKPYITPFIKYWWLILAACLISSISSFLVTRGQPPIYQTRATLVIGRAVYEANPSNQEFVLNRTLAGYYANIAQRGPVRNATMETLGLNFLPGYVARPLANDQMLEIVVTDTSPQRAQAVANELANQLVLQAPTNSQLQEQEHRAFVDKQLGDLEVQITDTQAEITRLEAELGTLNSARQISETQNQIGTLRNLLTTLQSNYAQLLVGTDRSAINTLTIVEPAFLPGRPIGPNVGRIVMLTTVVALVISMAAAFLLEFLDDTLKTSTEIARYLNLPVLGYLLDIKSEQDVGGYVAKKPRSRVADAFRSLRTNLEFTGIDKPIQTMLLSSPGVGEGKTSLAVNLAIVMAQGGKEVILMDADLRRPNIHLHLGLPNDKGLTDVFRGNMDIDDVKKSCDQENLSIITSGGLPPNPTDLLGSAKMDSILEQLKQNADIVIIDGPPFLVTDATVLANKVDGVLFVIRHGFTRRGPAVAAIEQLSRMNTRVLGVALNRLPRSMEAHYGDYRYYQHYYGVDAEVDEEEQVSLKNGRPDLAGIFKRARNLLPGSARTK